MTKKGASLFLALAILFSASPLRAGAARDQIEAMAGAEAASSGNNFDGSRGRIARMIALPRVADVAPSTALRAGERAASWMESRRALARRHELVKEHTYAHVLHLGCEGAGDCFKSTLKSLAIIPLVTPLYVGWQMTDAEGGPVRTAFFALTMGVFFAAAYLPVSLAVGLGRTLANLFP